MKQSPGRGFFVQKLGRIVGAHAMVANRPGNQRPICKMDIKNLTKIAEEVGAEAVAKANRVKGWNLICCLYSEPRTAEDDLAHAYATEARSLSLLSLRLTCAKAEAGLRGNTKKYERLTKAIEEVTKREMRLSALCHEAIKAAREADEKAKIDRKENA